jgi:hypothetical protein
MQASVLRFGTRHLTMRVSSLGPKSAAGSPRRSIVRDDDEDEDADSGDDDEDKDKDDDDDDEDEDEDDDKEREEY